MVDQAICRFMSEMMEFTCESFSELTFSHLHKWLNNIDRDFFQTKRIETMQWDNFQDLMNDFYEENKINIEFETDEAKLKIKEKESMLHVLLQIFTIHKVFNE